MLDFTPRPRRFRAMPSLPVGAIVLGRRTEEVLEILPRIFGLCRSAQAAALRAALDLPPDPGGRDALREEILRDHLAKFLVELPRALGEAPSPLPEGWARQPELVASTVWGAPEPPADGDAVEAFLAEGRGVAPVLNAIDAAFGLGDCAAEGLTPVTSVSVYLPVPAENSVAGRQANHPAMQHLEATRGRGPLWRAAARLWDIADVLADRLPEVERIGPHRAVAPAARGLYAVEARAENDRITAFSRLTPTDHMLREGGIADRALETLPPGDLARARVLMAVLDPCTRVTLVDAPDA